SPLTGHAMAPTGHDSKQRDGLRDRRRATTGRAARAILALTLALGFLAAAAPAEARKYPKIFGSIELFSKKVTRFPKWVGMVDRFQDGAKTCDSATCTTKGWKEFIAG